MNKFVLSVIGKDKPGILAKISTILFTHGCNIEDVSQTILQTEFASIFIVLNPDSHPLDEIGRSLNTALADMVSSGAWQTAIDNTVGPSGFKPDAAKNPPKADACA